MRHMRFATIVHHHPDGWFQSLGKAFAEEDDVTPVALHSPRLLDNGLAIFLYELKGDARIIRKVLDETEIATSYQVAQSDGSTIAYIHFEPTTTVERLLRAPAAYGLVIDDPITIKDHGSIEITLIGAEEDIQEALAATPDELTVTIKRVGDYTPSAQQLFTSLSERQQQVLRTAHELGYYEQPRRTTYKDIANEFDCTPANVGEILRRIENSLIDEIVRTHFNTESERSV